MKRIPVLFTSGINRVPYRPLRWLSHAIEYKFYGLNPTGYHITNITLHVLTSILVYLTIFALVKNSRTAFFAALLFAVHPVHTDSVTYISGRRDILSTLFYILGFYLFLEHRKKKRLKFLTLAFASYLLALASKEMAVTLPAIFFFYDFLHSLPDEGSPIKRSISALKNTITSHKLLYSFFFLMAILFAAYKVLLKSPSNKEGFYGGDLYIQLLTVSKILIHYIKQLLFPINLIADYSFNSFPLPSSLFEPGVLFSLMALCAIAFLTLKLIVRNKIMAFCLIWFFVTLLPVCHIFPHHELLAEHYLYLPSFGFVLLIAMVFEQLLTSPRWKNYIQISFVLLIILFSIRTIYRNYDWKDSFTIWKKTVKTVPNCARALNNLGIEYYERKEGRKAKSLFQQAINIQPSYEKAYYNLGNFYRSQQQFQHALEMYKKAAQMQPKNFKAHNNLGNAYAMQKLYKQAIKSYRRAIKLKPRYAQAHNNLGNAYRSTGRVNLAVTHYQKAIRIKLRYTDAYCNLAHAYSDLKQYEKAIQYYKYALWSNPDHAQSHYSLGALYARRGSYDHAIHEFTQVTKNQPRSPEVPHAKGFYAQPTETLIVLKSYLNLGTIYLENLNDKQKAIQYFKKCLEIAPSHPVSNIAKEKISELEK